MGPNPIGGGRCRSRRSRPIAASVALLLIVSLVPACSSSHRDGHPPPSTTAVATATTTTVPPPEYTPSPYSWDRSTDPSLALGGGASATLSAVLAPQLSGSWQVFGSRQDQTRIPTATIWSSSDGTSWTAAALGPPSEPGRALAAAQYKATTVVVGSTGVGSDQQAAVWLPETSGGAYAPQAVPVSDGPSWMNLATAGSLGMFATGMVDGRFAMWTSTNGRVWTEASRAEKVITSSPGAQVNALLAAGDFVYAAGSIQTGPTTEAAVWSSSNGLDWHLVSSAGTSFTGPGDRVIYSLAPFETGLVATGAINDGNGWLPASWISPDGQSWSLPSTNFPGTPTTPRTGPSYGPSGGSAIRSVSSIETLAGATSLVAAGGGPYGQAAWQSTDGIHWSAIPLPAADATATSWRAELAAATVGQVVVMDAEPGQPYMLSYREPSAAASGRPAQSGVWTQPSANPLTFGPVRPEAVPVSLRSVSGRLELEVQVVHRPQVIGPATATTTQLWSSDGTSWTPSEPSGTTGSSLTPAVLPAPGALTARLPDAWVAVASPASTSPEVWTSSDGRSWKARGVLRPAESGTVPPATTGSVPAASASAATVPGEAATTAPSSAVSGVCTARLPATAGQPAHYLVVAVGSTAATATSSDSDGSGSGSGPTLVTTRSAAAWSSTTGSSWRPASVGPQPPSGGTQTMTGCLAVGSELVAFGSTTGPTGSPQPALWRSADGSSWTRISVGTFAAGAPQPLISVAEEKADWLGAASPDPQVDPFSTASAGWPGPAATTGDDAGVGPAPSVQDGRSGLWLAVGGITSWQLIDTSVAPWLGADQSQIDLVAFAPPVAAAGGVHATSTSGPTSTSAPGSNPTAIPGASTTAPGSAAAAAVAPVVVGVVDGRLAVWTGSSS